VGYDISAFNVLLTRVKVASYDLALLAKEAHDILHKVRRATARERSGHLALWQEDDGAPPQNDPSLAVTNDEYLRQWFAPKALHELLTYRSLIDTEGYMYKDFLKVILSRSARSARLAPHFDLDFPKRPQTEPYWCYKHSRVCTPTDEAYKFMERYTVDALRRVREFAAKRTTAAVTVYQADSRTAEFPRADGVITSPPYVGLIDYHEQHAYAYHLLSLADLRQDEIGPAANGSTNGAKVKYQQDIAQVFSRMLGSLPPGAPLIVVANDRFGLYGEIATMVGVEVEAVIERHVNRRTGRRSSDFYESIFVWRRP